MKTSGTEFQSKLPDIGTSIFTIMTKMANDYKAINLSQGFPDFDPPEELKKLVNHFIESGHNQYAPMQGVKILRERISDKIRKLYGSYYNPNHEITITAGATEALYTAITTVVKPGDEVIIFEPAYDLYTPTVVASGGTPVYIPLKEPGFTIDWEMVNNSLTNRTKLIIINSPHNPTGSVLNRTDIIKLEELTADKDIFILSDEVYEHILFDNNRHESISKSIKLAKKAFIISSFGKTYHATGWKVGYCAAPAYLTKEFRKIHQFVVFAVNTPVQYAYAEYILNYEHYMELNKFYQRKRDFFISMIKTSRFNLSPANGTYFQLLDYSGISGMNDIKFSEYLTKEVGVAVIPLSPFYSGINDRKLIRICFAKKDEVLVAAAEKLCKI